MIQNLPVLIVVFPFLFGLLVGIIGPLKKLFCFYLALFSTFCSSALSFYGIFHTLKVGNIEYNLGGWAKNIGIAFYLTPYNSIVLFLISLVSFFVILYSGKTVILKFKDKVYAFYALLLFFLTGNLGIVITGDAFNLYVFLEIVSLSSYSMVALGNKESYVAALRYLIIGTVGATFYLLGVGILYLKTGSLNMTELHSSVVALYGLQSIKASLLFIVIGLSIKIAFFPFHSWLPFAYSKTISPVSALMSPIVTKVSLFALIKVLVLVFGIEYVLSLDSLKTILPNLAAFGMIYFSIKAYTQKNIRASFCYILLMECSLMFGALWLGDILGIKTSLYHIVLDIVMTVALFLFAGILETYYKIRNFNEVDKVNILSINKVFCVSFIIILLSVLGIPPTGGFFSKFYFILVAFKSSYYFFIVSLIVSSFIIFCVFLRLFEKIYFNNKKEGDVLKNKLPFSLDIIFLVCAFIVLFIGFNTNFIFENIITSFIR